MKFKLMVLALFAALGSAAGAEPIEIAAAVSLTGAGDFYGNPVLDGIRLAVDEANRDPAQAKISLTVDDDHSSPQEAATLAARLGTGRALAVIGPVITAPAMAAGPVYAKAGLVSIVASAHGDDVTGAPTSFQPVYNAGDNSAFLANYLFHVLHGRSAAVLYHDDDLGHPMAEGFRRASERLGLRASFHRFTTEAERLAAIAAIAAQPDHPAVILAMLKGEAVSSLLALRRAGVMGPVLGPDALAADEFGQAFAGQPEEEKTPGYFTNNLYASAPIIFDSADAEILGFAQRFQDHYGKAPSWLSAQGYDAARLAITAARHAAQAGGDIGAMRQAVRNYLAALDGPSHAVDGVTGPLWFTPNRGRIQAVRMGRFQSNRFDSAPVQLVPAPKEAGSSIEVLPGEFVRRQQVVYSGIYLNEVSRIDIAGSSFTADFYVWLRFAPGAGESEGDDPVAISLPDMIKGSFDAKHPAAEHLLEDGTVYRLWRVTGDFKNDFDLHHYPLDRQSLAIRLVNARSATDRIVYVNDRRTFDAADLDSPYQGNAAPGAFRNLTQWNPLGVAKRRDLLVTHSALGDPLLVGLDRKRELSGFSLIIQLRRYLVATLAKTLLPLGIMTAIMLASLYFPPGLVKEKVTVAITAALSGAVLLSAVNSQLGTVGYTMAVEYVFYVYFLLCLCCILSVLVAERFRAAGRAGQATRTEVASRLLFLAVILATLASAIFAAHHW